MEIIGTLFCGLGLFFIGFRMISRNLRKLTGSRFRQMVWHATRIPFLSAVIGFLSGIVTQSAMASVFITSGFHTAGLLPYRRSITIINWANIGTSVLVFIVILNIKLLIFYFTGLIGLAYFLNIDKGSRVQVLLQCLLGLALLFLGIQFIRNAAGPMQSLPWFRDALQGSAGSVALLFLCGTALTVAAQSGPTVSVVALSLTTAGLLTMPQTVVVVLGTGVGSAINILLFASELKGTGKQLCLYQCIFKIIGVVIVAILFMIDYWSGDTGTVVLSRLSSHPGQQVAFVHLAMQLLPMILLTATIKPVTLLLQRMAPSVTADALYQPVYINEPALNEPETALYLASKEQLRLLHLLPDYLLPVSPDRNSRTVHNHTVLHEGFGHLDQQIRAYLEKLSKDQATPGIHEKILEAQHFSSLLSELESNLDEFVTTVYASFDTLIDQPLSVQLVESLRTILDTSIDYFENPDPTNKEIVLSITADKGAVLQKTRQDFFQKNAMMESGIRQSIYTMTILFDRVCWGLRKMTAVRE